MDFRKVPKWHETKTDIEFIELTKKLMAYLADYHNPHTIIIIESTNAQIFEGVKSTGEILDFIKD